MTLANPTTRHAARALLRRLGVPCVNLPVRKLAWNGRVLFCGRRNASILIHDAAHWLLAAKRRQRLPEWGLGMSPDADWSAKALHDGSLEKMECDFAIKEEQLASLLGILYERELGLPWMTTYDDHEWTLNVESRDWQTAILALHRRGLIDGAGRPTQGLDQ